MQRREGRTPEHPHLFPKELPGSSRNSLSAAKAVAEHIKPTAALHAEHAGRVLHVGAPEQCISDHNLCKGEIAFVLYV